MSTTIGTEKSTMSRASVRPTFRCRIASASAQSQPNKAHLASEPPCQNFRLTLRCKRSAERCRLARLHVVAAASAPWTTKDARLVLADGTVFHGRSFGARGTKVAEVVFNTSLSGYQEIMTDPSYKDQMVCFTCPHIGNVGINEGDNESTKCHLEAVLIRALSFSVSNYRAVKSLDDFCKEQGVVGLADIDTRKLTRILREVGCLNGAISTESSKTDDELLQMAKDWSIEGRDLLSVVTASESKPWSEKTVEEWEFNPMANGSDRYKVVAYDFGIKHNILNRLSSLGCDVTVVPAQTPASDVLAMEPDGVFFSNGPGDPSAAPYAVDNAKEILGKKPVFGICMGHQILGQAFGGSTFKLKFGHHGGNHPIRDMASGKVQISAQNHNFAVDPATLPEGVTVSHINLNDGTCAGMRYPEKQALTIQYHPESSPGPHDADICFDEFVGMMKTNKA